MEDLDIKEKKILKVDNLMWRVARLLSKTKKSILDNFNLTCSQFEILTAIYQFSINQNDVIQINLSEKTQIDPMTTSTVLKNLQRRGLIRRERGLVNTRTVEVTLTESGETLYYKAKLEIDKLRKELYQAIDQEEFVIQLQKLSKKLTK